MPSGNTHATLTILSSAVVFGTAVYFAAPFDTTLALTTGCLIGLAITPDLDYADRRRTLWHRFWWLYGKAIAHRSTLSHFPIFSTAFRVLYLSPIPLAFVLYHNITPTLNWLYAFIGLCVADTIHYIADVLTTSIKRSF